MQSGIFYGHVAMIEGLVARIKQQLITEDPSHPTVRVIATGGLAPLIHKHTTVIDQIEPELTLNGLRVIYDLNAESPPAR